MSLTFSLLFYHIFFSYTLYHQLIPREEYKKKCLRTKHAYLNKNHHNLSKKMILKDNFARIIKTMISPHHNFLQIDLQWFIFFEVKGPSRCGLQRLIGLQSLVFALQKLLANLALNEVNYRLNVVVETIL